MRFASGRLLVLCRSLLLGILASPLWRPKGLRRRSTVIGWCTFVLELVLKVPIRILRGGLSSDKSWQCGSMLQPFRTTPRSLCSSAANALTIQMYAQRSIVWVRAQKCPLHFWQQSPIQSVGGRVLVATAAPIRLTDRDNPHRPKSFSLASAFPSTAPRQPWHHRDPGHQQDGRELPAPSPKYLLKYAFFGHLFSSQHHNRAAPFFGRLDTLTIQNSRAGLRMTASGLLHLSAQRIVNALPGSVPAPGA